MVIRALILLFCAVVCCDGQSFYAHRRTCSRPPAGGAPPHNPPASPLILETFEGAGYVNTGWTETLNGGTIDEDYTGVVLDGAQSLRIVTGNGTSTYIDRTVTAAGQLWFFFQFRPVTLSGTKSIIDIADNAATTLGKVTLSAAGVVTVFSGATSVSTVNTMGAGGQYNVWVEYNKNNGANRICNVGFSTSTTRPTSGNGYAQASTTTSAVNIGDVFLGNFGTDFGSPVEYLYDYFIIDDAQIGDNP